MTRYLHAACLNEWPKDYVGKAVEWPGGNLKACQGSGGVTQCIRETRGTISYLDVGHGHQSNLGEVALANLDGTTLTSLTAIENNGISSAADQAALPAAASGDFSDVSLINQPGQYTWPIVSTTYLYVRKDISFISDPNRQALLFAFLEALYDDTFITECEEVYKLNRVRGKALALAKDALEGLLDAQNRWTFETDTIVVQATGDTYVSGKRRSAVDLAIEQKRLEVNQLQDEYNEMSLAYADALEKISLLRQEILQVYEQRIFAVTFVDAYDSAGPEVALAFSIITLFFWTIFGISTLLTNVRKKRAMENELMEQAPQQEDEASFQPNITPQVH